MLLLVGSAGLAQIPNAGFENWTNGNPDGWVVVSNLTAAALGGAANVTQSSTAFAGSSSVSGAVMQYYSLYIIPPSLESGLRGFAVGQRYVGVSGNYQFSPVNGDKLSLSCLLYKGGSPIALIAKTFPTATSGWQSFNVPFAYIASDIPDTCHIQISIIGPVTGSDYHIGSSMLVDNLAFYGTTDVNSFVVQPNAFRLDQNFPNPFNPSTEIQFQLPGRVQVRLVVYNTLGQQVKELVNNEMNAGSFTATWDGKNDRGEYVGSGVYLYKLVAGNYLVTKKMVLMK